MTRPYEGQDPSELDAYLDGALSAEARAAFELRLQQDGGLRDEVELQRRIDARVRVLAGAPEFPGLSLPEAPVAGSIGAGSSGAAAGGRRRLSGGGWVRIAAAVAIVALGAWAIVMKPWNTLLDPAPSEIAADAVYDRLVRTGFEPVMVCDTDEKFLDYTTRELGAAFLVRAAPDVRLVGWTYAEGLLGEHAKVLLARRGETPVVVVMDRAANDRSMRLSEGSPLRLHRAVHDGVVLYEIGPDASPVIVNRLAGR